MEFTHIDAAGSARMVDVTDKPPTSRTAVATGTLRTWDISGRLGEIDVPTLITCGRYDEATPAIAAALQRGIAGSEVAIFERSAHMAHLEEAARYNEVLAGFLARAERQG